MPSSSIISRAGPKKVTRGFIQLAAGEAIKSATIPAVNMDRAELRLLGANVTAGAGVQHLPTLKLGNATTIWAQRFVSGYQCDLEWELTEW